MPSSTTDVDTLVAEIERWLPYEWESTARKKLSDLAARALDTSKAQAEWIDMKLLLKRAEAAEADRDRLARRVAELEQENETLRLHISLIELADDRVAELEAALPPLERVARAAKNAEKLWDKRMLGASFVVPARDDPDPLTQAWYELNEALDALAGDGGGA